MTKIPPSALARAQSELGWNVITGASNGYAVPGSAKKAMKGFTATANSPDRDTIHKLQGTRAASRDLFMNSPLAVGLLRRLRTFVINSGLQLQSVTDRELLGLPSQQARAIEATLEREFDMWAHSLFSDFEQRLMFPEQQSVGFLNLLLSGDFFVMTPWEKREGSPYELSVKLIDADLVRDPARKAPTDDIQGGVEHDSRGRVVAYHVWNTYPYETIAGKQGTSVRVPVFDENGRQQIFHVFNPERLHARRGVALLAPVVESLKQLTRLADAELMGALVASFFTVFVKDATGFGAIMGDAFTPEETVTGGGRYGPGAAPSADKVEADANDLEMGYGNVTYLDDQKDIEIAEPRKTDENFADFWAVLSRSVCAAGGVPLETAQMHYQTSYTAAKAATNDLWKEVRMYRALMVRRFIQIVYNEFVTEAVLKGRVQAPQFFDDPIYKAAWCGARWIGVGMGAINPLDEAKASVVLKNNKMTTHEDEYTAREGGRYDKMLSRLAQEYELMEELGLGDASDPNDIIGSDGQQDPGEQ